MDDFQLFDILANDNEPALRDLIENGLDPDYHMEIPPNDVVIYGSFPLPILTISASLASINCVKTLIEYGAEPNNPNEEGTLPLHAATYSDSLKIMKILIKNGTDIDATDYNGITALHICARMNHLDIAIYLHKKRATYNTDNSGRTPLYYAAKYGSIDVTEYFLSQRVDVNCTDIDTQTPLHIALIHNHFDIVNVLLNTKNIQINVQDSMGVLPIMIAASKGLKFVINEMLKMRPNLRLKDTHGSTVLHYAAKYDDPSIMSALMFTPKALNWQNKAGFTPLHIACQFGCVENAKFMLSMKSNPTIKDGNGNLPVFLAAKHSHGVIVRNMYLTVPNPEVTNNYGLTLIHIIARTKDVETMKIILDNADIDLVMVDHMGLTPLHYAAKNSSLEMVRLLVEMGSDKSLPEPNNMETPYEKALKRGSRRIAEWLESD